MSLLDVQCLGISFGGLRAVNNVSFSAKAGEIVSVIGPNGAGKTTLFNMISGVYLPGEGKVMLEGRDITAKRPDRLANLGLTRTFQNLQIFQEMTVLENVIAGFHLQERGALIADLLSLPASKKRAAEAKRGAEELLVSVGLQKAAERQAGNLSYGALKRLEIARALAVSPRVLLLDEPAAGCNAVETEEIDRLRTHVEATRTLVDKGGVVGRKLDFLMQEFNREANTLCAKSQSADLTAVGLELKAVIDQIREQVQNVE